MRRLWLPLLFVLSLSLLITACGGDETSGPDADAVYSQQLRESYDLASLVLPDAPLYPPDNPPVAERIALGRLLFFDPILSGDMDVSCGHCHHPGFGWSDGRELAAGVTGEGIGPDRIIGDPTVGETPRNTPSCLDTGFNAPPEGMDPWMGKMFWEGRVLGLESQARRPIRSRDEMLHDAYTAYSAMDTVVTRLRTVDEYIDLFEEAFPTEAALLAPTLREEIIDANTYARAVAAYERELFAAAASFDAFAKGDDAALTRREKEGLELFFESGCADCHNGYMFSDYMFYAVGVKQGGPGRPPIHERGDGTDRGRFLVEALPEYEYAFRTPTLRELIYTAPYFHTGGKEWEGDPANGIPAGYDTIEKAVEFFNRGCNDQGIAQELLPEQTAPLNLSADEVGKIADFLRTLSGRRLGSQLVDPTVPAAVPSGLTPPQALEPSLR